MLNIIKKAYTFDDVLLIPNYSNILPKDVSLTTQLSRNLTFNIPILSAAMDTVTTAPMAIAMALAGGIGIIHKNLSTAAQAEQVQLVKQYDCSILPETISNKTNLAANGCLMVGAAVGVAGDTAERVKLLIAAGVDVIIVDTAHGHSAGVINRVRLIKRDYPHIDVIGGNIATADAANALADAGADGVKVGVGPGSICTTRIIAGVGVPQLTAINDVATALSGSNIPVIADGGIRFSGDIAKALAAGASSVMLGSLLAGTDEAPGEIQVIDGKRYKTYRGMGSLGAMSEGSADRYFQEQTKNQDKLVAEGIEARTLHKGSLNTVIHQLTGGLSAAMGYLGVATIKQLQQDARFVEMSAAGIKESHVHDVIITKTAPNYMVTT